MRPHEKIRYLDIAASMGSNMVLDQQEVKDLSNWIHHCEKAIIELTGIIIKNKIPGKASKKTVKTIKECTKGQ